MGTRTFFTNLFWLALIMLVSISCHPYLLNKKESVYNTEGKRIISVEDEEGIHSNKSIEWWYHYGFFNVSVSDSNLTHPYDSIGNYSFYSSFVMSPGGRMLIYKITDLRTGKNHYNLVFDKILSLFSLLIKDKKNVFTFSKCSNEKQGAPLDLNFDNSILKEQKTSYSFVLNDDSVLLSLLILKSDTAPALLPEGTGLIGMKHPSDVYYYSYPNLPAKGKIKTGSAFQSIEGNIWYDHQWAKPFPNKKVRWTWWGLQLDNGDALNLYIVKHIITGKLLLSSVTRIDKTGKIFVYRNINASSHRSWHSPRTNIEYPVEWTLEIPEWGYDLHITPVWDDHEMPILIYNYFWEGPCSVNVSVHGSDEKISGGKGYQELVGFYYDKFKLFR